MLRDIEDQYVIRNYFYIKHGADTLQAAINQTFNSLLTTVHGRDTETLRNVINYNWYSKNIEGLRFLGPTDGGYKANENWCIQIFKDENINSSIALLSMIQNKALQTESFF